VHTHLSQGLSPSIFTVLSLWYLSSCFSFTFFEGYYPVYFFEEIFTTSLFLVSVTWETSQCLLKVVSLSRALFQNFLRSSNHFLFISSSLHYLHLVFSFALALVVFLIFWAIYSTQCASAASSKWAWIYCSSLCYCCISWHCCSSILVLASEILEDR